MRKAALILGIVCALFTLLGATLKVLEFPGGSLLLILGVGIFTLFALPVQLIYNIRRNKNSLRRSADVIGLFGLWFLFFGLLYKAQSWPGAQVVLLGGIVITLVFAVFFIAASRKPEVTTNWISGFTVCGSIIVVSLSVAWIETSGDKIDLEEQNLRYQASKEECRLLILQCDEFVKQIDVDTAWDRNDTLVLALHYNTMLVLQEMETVKSGLMYEAAVLAGADPNDGLVHKAGDIDITTWYMVGSDPQFPSGHGMEIYDMLKRYRNEILPAQVSFTVPTPEGSEAKEQWVKDNFYHATVLEALERITRAEIAVAASLKTALETKAYIESK